MYQALYRKWRPKTFSDVIGQSHDLADLHALLRVKLVAGNRWPAADVGHGNTNAEVSQCLLQLHGSVPVLLLRITAGASAAAL